MTPLLLAFGVYANLAIVLLMTAVTGPKYSESANFLDGTFLLHLGMVIYFWVKVSDIILGWSA